ncbi:MAG: hypothetical protein AB1750_15445 [Chloroflexota bacterium]
MKTRSFRAMIVIVLLAILAAPALSAQAAPPNGVDHLRGRWIGKIENLDGEDQPFQLLLGASRLDPNDSQAAFYNGCIAIGYRADYAPVSARVVILGNGEYELTLFGTASTNGSIVRLDGSLRTFGASVRDDTAGGTWQTSDQQGDWKAGHHDRRQVRCPIVDVGGDLWFEAGVTGVIQLDDQNAQHPSFNLHGDTNIVSAGMLVVSPDGSSSVIPFYTDLFSPNVDFVNTFRYLEGYDGSLPVAGGTYKFTLLDVFGNPIPGTTQTDTWYGCTMDAPRNVSASVIAEGIWVTWDAAPSAPGFDPSSGIGFYQIVLFPDGPGDGGYGANLILFTAHLIPLASFGGFAPGDPDGNDFGMALSELADGIYAFDVISFSEAPVAGPNVGPECQVRAWNEQVRFEVSGGVLTILP